MRPDAIRKSLSELPVTPHLADLNSVCAAFSWQQVRDELTGPAGTVMNIAQLAVDRHAAGVHAQRTALRFLAAGGAVTDLTYAELKRQTDGFANALVGLGVGPGDRVFVLAGRMPAMYVAVLGALKNGSVVTPLFSAFGPGPIATRIGIGGARVPPAAGLGQRLRVQRRTRGVR